MTRMSSPPAPKARAPLWVVILIAIAVAVWRYGLSGPAVTPVAPATVTTSASGAASPAPRAPHDPTHDLTVDEQRGGHTLARHVGRTDEELAERLERERDISAASTYTDRASAERTVARALATDGARVQAWLARRGNRPNLALTYHGRDVIGRSLARGARAIVPCVNALVVLRWTPDGAFVLTSYPEASR